MLFHFYILVHLLRLAIDSDLYLIPLRKQKMQTSGLLVPPCPCWKGNPAPQPPISLITDVLYNIPRISLKKSISDVSVHSISVTQGNKHMDNIYDNTPHSVQHIVNAQEIFYSEYGFHCTKRQLRQKTKTSAVKVGLLTIET